MNNSLKTFAFAASAALLAAPAFADDPRPVDPAVAQSKDSGAVDRAAPEMKLVLQKLMDLGAKPVSQLDVKTARTQPSPADAVKAVVMDKTGAPATPEAVKKTEDVKVAGAAGDIPARVYWPADVTGDAALPLIVYYHGGGWVIATIDTYDASARALANQAHAVVVSIEYRKGPEDKFPAAHDDTVAAYKYAVENAGKWNADGTDVAVAGESAGGNMAIDVAIAARDQKLTAPKAVLAVYPVAGSDLNTSHTRTTRTPFRSARPTSSGSSINI